MHEVVAKLDDLGRPAWLILLVLSFMVFWPLGLVVLFYMIGSGRMGCGRHGEMTRWQQRMADKFDRKMERWDAKMQRWRERNGGFGFTQTGNRAFDEYREEALRRLEEEAREFREYLERLRHARDRAEFDQYMAERRNRQAGQGPGPGPAGTAPPST
jgi:hypothetical protein